MANPLTILSLRGGQNDTDPPNAIQDDQCALAKNVEFYYSMLGERRLGCEPLDISGSGLDDELETVHLSQGFPNNDIQRPELWAIAATPGFSVTVANRLSGVWHNPTLKDAVNDAAPDIYKIVAQFLHEKQFFAYHSSADRLHVRDTVDLTTIRRTGLAQPAAAPTAANEGSGSTYTTVRYFRMRYIIKSGSQIVVRSEPSAALTFTPSGTGAGATITKAAAINEGETDWELEASNDGANFYRIATIHVATTTYTDTTQNSAFYSDEGPLSEAVGAYLLIPAVKYLGVDGDRLLFGSHFTDATLQSRVGWTPVFNDPGVGNDERYPIATTGGEPVNSFIDLDGFEGGGLTGLSQVANGTWYAFKWNHIYRLSRTGDPTNAYQADTLSKSRGAIEGSVIGGMDEFGQACLYFIDPTFGPSRLGNAGLETIRGLRNTWTTFNSNAANVAARGVYYQDKQQVHWWIATGQSDYPLLKLVLQVTEAQDSGNSVTRGWSIADGRIAGARCVAIFNEVEITALGAALRQRPFIGLPSPDFIQRCDIGDDDAQVPFQAIIQTKAFMPAGILQQWETMVGSLLATSDPVNGVKVTCIRDFGTESNSVETDLKASADQLYVIKILDDLKMAEAYGIQFEFADRV